MNQSSKIKEQIIKNSFWNIVNSAINRFGSFILVILLSRMLLPEGFGRYSTALTIALFFITFSDMGISQTLIRYASININNKKSSSYFRYLFKIKFYLSLILFALLLIISYPLSVYIYHDKQLFLPLLILSFYVLFVSLTSFFESLFFIKKNVKYISAKETVLLFLKIGSIFLVGFFITQNFKLPFIFAVFSVLYGLVLIFDFCLTRHLHPNLFIKTTEEINKKDVKKFILSLNIQNISLTILNQATILILGIFLAQEYVGYYNSSLILVISFANLFLFSSVFIPIMSGMNKETFRNFVEKIFRFFLLIALPISFGLSVLSRYFIFFIYGEKYLSASIPLSILSFLIPCIIGIDLSLASFSSKNKMKKFSVLMGLVIPIFLVLNYFFIINSLPISDEMSIIGASVANLLTWLFCFAISVLLLKREFNIMIISSSLIKSLFSCIIMTFGLFFLINNFGEMNIFKGILLIIFGAAIYLIGLFLMKGIKIEDLKSFSDFLRRKIVR